MKPAMRAVLAVAAISLWMPSGQVNAGPVLTLAQLQDSLPNPIYDGDPDLVRIYWGAWHYHIQNRIAGGGALIPEYMDEGYSSNLFSWDTSFMTMFNKYGWYWLPTIVSMDNFYNHLHSNGLIPHEISSSGSPALLAPFVYAWAEWEHYKLTADKNRLRHALPFLVRHFDAFIRDRKIDPGTPAGYYKNVSRGVETWQNGYGFAVGNSANGDDYAARSIVECASMIPHQGEIIAAMAREIGQDSIAVRIGERASAQAQFVRTNHWDPLTQSFRHKDAKNRFHLAFQATTFWPLLAGAADTLQARSMARHLFDPLHFRQDCMVPSATPSTARYIRRMSPMYDAGYWSGGAWAPTNYVVTTGLHRYGMSLVAREVAMVYLRSMADLLLIKDKQASSTGFYPIYPESFSAEWRQDASRNTISPDKGGLLVGWTGLEPVAGLIEDVIGIRVDAPANRIRWSVRSLERSGIAKLRFGGNTVDLICQKRTSWADPVRIQVSSREQFTLELDLGNRIIERQFTGGNATWDAGISSDPAVAVNVAPPPRLPPAKALTSRHAINGACLGMSLADAKALFTGRPVHEYDLTLLGAKYGHRARAYLPGQSLGLDMVFDTDNKLIYAQTQRGINPLKADSLLSAWETAVGSRAVSVERFPTNSSSIVFGWGDVEPDAALLPDHGKTGQSLIVVAIADTVRGGEYVQTLRDGPGIERMRKHLDMILAASPGMPAVRVEHPVLNGAQLVATPSVNLRLTCRELHIESGTEPISTVTITDVRGRLVRRIVTGRPQKKVVWNLRDGFGATVARETYLVTTNGQFTLPARIVEVR